MGDDVREWGCCVNKGPLPDRELEGWDLRAHTMPLFEGIVVLKAP